MTEITFKIDVPDEFKERFELALARLTQSLTRELELLAAKEIVSKSKFTEEEADELSNKVKQSMLAQLKSDKLI